MSRRIAVFPGSFDPITNGHEDIIRRAVPMFDQIIIAIGVNTTKKSFFPLEKRKDWIKKVFRGEKKINVMSYSGLTVNFCKTIGANYILRGLRTSADFEFERAIGQMNKAMTADIETVFLLTSPEFSAISSTIVRDIIRNGGDAKQFVPKGVIIK